MRRRLRYLRTARELSYRDLGGLLFDLHRFGGRREELLAAKLGRLGEVDRELRALEAALEDRQPVTVLREAGVVACPRCAAIHGTGDNFCPHCGMGVSRESERPVTIAPPGAQTPAPTQSPATASALGRTPGAAPPPATVRAPGAVPATAAYTPVNAPPPIAPAVPTVPPPAMPVSAPAPATATHPAVAPPAATTAPAPAMPHAPATPIIPPGAPPAGMPPQVPKADDAPNADQPTEIIRRPEQPEGPTGG